MPTTIEFFAPSGLSLRVDLYKYESNVIANPGGNAATEDSVKKCLYTAIVSDDLFGWHTAHFFDTTSNLCVDVAHVKIVRGLVCKVRDKVFVEDGTVIVEADPVGSTDFEMVLKYTRALTFDTDSEAYRNTSATLKLYMQMILPLASFSATFDPVNNIFDRALTSSELLELSCRSALQILPGYPEDFSYRTPFMQGRRKWDVTGMISRIEDMLKNLGLGYGSLAISSYNEIQKIYQDADLFSEALTEAQNA
jgi:hypothetical protein